MQKLGLLAPFASPRFGYVFCTLPNVVLNAGTLLSLLIIHSIPLSVCRS
jgi:hypothetical protein